VLAKVVVRDSEIIYLRYLQAKALELCRKLLVEALVLDLSDQHH